MLALPASYLACTLQKLQSTYCQKIRSASDRIRIHSKTIDVLHQLRHGHVGKSDLEIQLNTICNLLNDIRICMLPMISSRFGIVIKIPLLTAETNFSPKPIF